MKDKHLIELIDVSKAYGGDVALSHIDLYIKDGEFLTLLGPSGCGKTTMLRLIAGFIMPDEGRIEMDGVDIANTPPYLRQVNTVFQKYALFPHLNVADNIAFGLKLRNVDKETIKQKVDNMLELVNLKGYGSRYVEQLSGGQQQRVAIARALVNEPKVLLLDEPLGALDLKLRKEMQVELKNMQQRLGITFIYVTHDQEEALTMSDTIVVLKDGVIQQIGTPTDIYNEPKNPFVADFIGESNIIPGIMLQDYKVRMNGVVYDCVDKGFGKNTEVDVVVRPEDIDIVPAEGARVVGKAVSVVFMGVHYEVDVDCGGYEWIIQTTDYVERGQVVGISIPPDAIHIMKKTQQTNFFDAVAYPDDNEVEFLGTRFACAGLEGFETRDDVLVAIAPADVRLVPPEQSELTGVVRACMFLGTHYEVTIGCGEEDWIAYSAEYMESGEEIGVSVAADKIAVSANEAN
ncbi:MAG TPA: ABC transporter ATP-binding protein [Clostridia bacterium]|nr:ABC transporter ATP-binding protein [Clostridia bacterium]